jgi:AcrR family transcriptional regulator
MRGECDLTPPATRAKRREPAERIIRADAQRNLDALLEAAKAVFAASGVDAPVREVAARANVGVATLYRHFPERADLIAAVFRREIDACAAAAAALGREHEPGEALARWLHRFTNLIATTRGLSDALSGDPASAALPAYFQQQLEPAVTALLDAGVSAGQVRSDVEPCELLRAVARLSNASGENRALRAVHGRRMVDLLIDGLRYGVPAPSAVRKGQRRPR